MAQKHQHTRSHKGFIINLINFVCFIVLVFWWHNKSAFAQESAMQYLFTQTDSSYTFNGSFEIDADPKCLLEICFNYEHIRALAPDAEEVILIDQGVNWNQIKYTYQKYFFFENMSAWYRKLDEENMRVDFTLLWSTNNLAIMPRIISSSGFYKIIPKENNILVEYHQNCLLSKESITNYYLDRVKKEAISFMRLFSEYASENCKVSSTNSGN
jgi:hypothetical protein